MGPDALQIIILILLIGCSAFFSGTETAFTCFNRTRMSTLAQAGNRKAKQVMLVEENYDKFLSTMLVGNNIVNIYAASLSTITFTKFLGGDAELGATVSTIVLTVVILIFGEITPKNLAKDFAESYTTSVIGVVRFLMFILTPITFVFSGWRKLLSRIFKKADVATITEEEIITMVDEAQNDGEIDEHEGELIRKAIDFKDLAVSEILTPRVDMVAVSDDLSPEEILSEFKNSGFSRIPVFHETVDNILGILHEKDFTRRLYEGSFAMSEMIHKALFVTESTKISRLLRIFQEKKSHMAIVVDEYGGTAGLVTLEDIIENLVGEIWDEHDRVVETVRKVHDNVYIVNASASLSELCDICSFDDDTLESNVTVNGWVSENLAKIPEVGDVFAYENIDVLVLKVDGRRATEIKITISETKDNSEEETDKKNSLVGE